MYAEVIMVKDVVTCRPDQKLSDIIELLNDKSFRMIPVINEQNKILGAVNTMNVLTNLVPKYIVQGYLKSIPFAPDMGVLRKHYKNILDVSVAEVMDRDPTIVHERDSLLSVTAEMITYDRFEYAIVTNSNKELVGIISSSDVLRCLGTVKAEELFDA